MISASLYRWFHEIDLGSCHIFILGCLLDTPKVVAFALRNSKPLTWSANKMLITEEEKAKARNPITTLENIVDARWTDPSSWSIELIEMIPEAYLFAMLRANKHGGTDAEKAKSNNVLTDLVPHIRAKPMFASCRYRLLLNV
nr:uncharacterized protein I203_07135 [Kwoniella mangroviensis CBS 8507]OCF63814.1 hypothetical protein I203_07135 [Kwoniella mangroviensis CBS 8507]